MKKLFLTIAAFSALTFTAVAQGDRTATPASQLTPDQKADKETARATSALGLNASQQITFKKLVLERANANQPIREQAKATSNKDEKQKFFNQVKANNEKFHTTVNLMLTPDQQTKWADHKKKMDAKRKEKATHQD